MKFIKDVRYTIRKFYRKLNRWLLYTKHLWRMSPWNEYDAFLSIIQLQLGIMSKEFIKHSIKEGAEANAQDMELVSHLLEHYKEEHYLMKYFDSLDRKNKGKDFDYDREKLREAVENDKKCLNTAFDLMKEKLPGWWQ